MTTTTTATQLGAIRLFPIAPSQFGYAFDFASQTARLLGSIADRLESGDLDPDQLSVAVEQGAVWPDDQPVPELVEHFARWFAAGELATYARWHSVKTRWGVRAPAVRADWVNGLVERMGTGQLVAALRVVADHVTRTYVPPPPPVEQDPST